MTKLHGEKKKTDGEEKIFRLRAKTYLSNAMDRAFGIVIQTNLENIDRMNWDM